MEADRFSVSEVEQTSEPTLRVMNQVNRGEIEDFNLLLFLVFLPRK